MEIDSNDFKQLIGLLQKLVETNINKTTESDSIDDEIDSSDDDNQINQKIKTVNKKLKPSKKKKEFVNKFLSMRESTMHKNDTEIDKKLNKYPPTQRSREFNFINVTCRVCGKTEQVAPGLVDSISRYKCNKCSTHAG